MSVGCNDIIVVGIMFVRCNVVEVGMYVYRM